MYDCLSNILLLIARISILRVAFSSCFFHHYFFFCLSCFIYIFIFFMFLPFSFSIYGWGLSKRACWTLLQSMFSWNKRLWNQCREEKHRRRLRFTFAIFFLCIATLSFKDILRQCLHWSKVRDKLIVDCYWLV